jgi:hypothetical protein
VAAAAQIGFFFGAVAAPRVRKLATEEHIIVGALVITGVVGAITAVVGGLLGAAMLSMTVGATGSAAKQAFDSIVQRDAPDANRGRSFAKFETRFQLVWVIGALIPIVVPIPADIGFAIIAVVAVAAVVTYWIGLRRIRAGKIPVKRQIWPRRTPAPPEETGLGVALDAIGDDTTVVSAPAVMTPPPAPSATPVPPAPDGPAPTVAPTAEPVDPTVVAADATVVAPVPSRSPAPAPAPAPAPGPDPARRWMRSAPVGPPPPAMPGSVPLPFPEPVAADQASVDPSPDPAPVAPADDARSHHREGLLFGPEAWDDATTPPAPPQGDGPAGS